MARMTLTDMIEIVRLGLGGETSETVSDTMLTRFINQSYMEVCASYAIPELEDSVTITTASGTAEYELGSPSGGDTLVVDHVVDSTNGLALKRINRRQYNDFTQGTSTVSGTPVYWFVSGVGSNNRKNITLYPEPIGVYSVVTYVRLRPDELVTTPTPTSPILPEPWDDSIVQRAISRGWKLLGDPDLGGKFNQMARENDTAALKISIRASKVPTYTGSIVGSAWNG